jgi:hypothetical protein
LGDCGLGEKGHSPDSESGLRFLAAEDLVQPNQPFFAMARQKLIFFGLIHFDSL